MAEIGAEDIALLLETVPHALKRLNDRLVKYEPVKKGKWKRQSRQVHKNHISGHIDHWIKGFTDDDHEAGATIRLMFDMEHEAVD
jgi:hypothetical protein